MNEMLGKASEEMGDDFVILKFIVTDKVKRRRVFMRTLCVMLSITTVVSLGLVCIFSGAGPSLQNSVHIQQINENDFMLGEKLEDKRHEKLPKPSPSYNNSQEQNNYGDKDRIHEKLFIHQSSENDPSSIDDIEVYFHYRPKARKKLHRRRPTSSSRMRLKISKSHPNSIPHNKTEFWSIPRKNLLRSMRLHNGTDTRNFVKLVFDEASSPFSDDTFQDEPSLPIERENDIDYIMDTRNLQPTDENEVKSDAQFGTDMDAAESRTVYRSKRLRPKQMLGRRRFILRRPYRSRGKSKYRLQLSPNHQDKYSAMRDDYESHRYNHESTTHPDEGFNRPNIFSQSDYNYEHRHTVRHPDSRFSGIRSPPRSINFKETPIFRPPNNDIERYTTYDGKYTINNNYRPPIGENQYNYKPTGSHVPPHQPPINYKPIHVEDYKGPPPSHPNEQLYPSNIYESPIPSHEPFPSFGPSHNPLDHPNKYPQNSAHQFPPSSQTSFGFQDFDVNNPSFPASPAYQPTEEVNYDNEIYESPPVENYDQSFIPPGPSYPPHKPSYTNSAHPYTPPKPSYTPPASSYTPQDPPYTPPASSYPLPEYPSKRPEVMPPAYNQEYATSDDQESNFPGPDIYDGGNIHGPPNVVIKDDFDKINTGVEIQNDEVGESHKKYSLENQHHYPGPTSRPTKRLSFLPTVPGYKKPTRHSSTYTSHSTKKAFSKLSSSKKGYVSKHPDGPDYSTATFIKPPYNAAEAAPFHVGLDLYPIKGYHDDGSNYDNSPDKQQILLELNLFSKKPSALGGGRSKSSGGGILAERKDMALDNSPEENLPLALKIPSLMKDHRVFGNLDPLDILQHLLKQSIEKKQNKEEQATLRSQLMRKSTLNAVKEQDNLEQKVIGTNRDYKKKVFNDSKIETNDKSDEKETGTTAVKGETEPEYYYYYYYDYPDTEVSGNSSHQASNVKSYEPLPTPLWQKK